jgi:hypothetical protein
MGPRLTMVRGVPSNHEFFVGCIFEDCSFHPVLCTGIEEAPDGDSGLFGISLIDGSAPRSCSVLHCGPALLTLEQAAAIRDDFDGYQRRRKAEIDAESSARG